MNDVRLGIFGARADGRGLAIQTLELSRHLFPSKVYGIDMQLLSPYPNDWDQYEGIPLESHGHEDVTIESVQRWLSGLDVVIGCETFYYPWFTSIAKQARVKTVLVVNYEFSAHVTATDWRPLPDVIAVPTVWHANELPKAYLLPHGIDRDRLPFRQRTEAKTFLHVVGHSAAYDRQGTKIVCEALRFIESDVKVILRSQRGLTIPSYRKANVDLQTFTESLPNYWDLYEQGDILLYPRRYGGQSLVMNEALSSGLPVIMPNASPQDTILPPEMLMPNNSFRRFRSTVADIPLHDIEPQLLARKIDELANDPEQVSRLSRAADQIAERQSWPNVLPEYEKLFGLLCR